MVLKSVADAALWLPRRIDRLADTAAHKALQREEVLVVEGHDHERGLWLHGAVKFVVCMAVMIAYTNVPSGWWLLPMGAVLGWAIGGSTMARANRAAAYRRGWLNGRLRFVQMAKQHQDQGNPPSVWMQTELDHDSVHVMGLPPIRVEHRDG